VIRAAITTLGALCMLGAFSTTAFAQSSAPASRLELGVGVRWIGTEQLGVRSATETTGSGGTSPLFSTTSELGGAVGLDGRVGVRVFRDLVVEAQGAYMKPELRIAISADAEGAAPVTATETIQQFTIGGDVVWYLPLHRSSPRLTPFAIGGAGYMRQLHDSGTLVDTGSFYHVGGGVSVLLGSGGRWHTKGLGVHADVQAFIRSNGVAFGDGAKASLAAGASFFVRF
jgi:hypothetical protein